MFVTTSYFNILIPYDTHNSANSPNSDFVKKISPDKHFNKKEKIELFKLNNPPFC